MRDCDFESMKARRVQTPRRMHEEYEQDYLRELTEGNEGYVVKTERIEC